MKIFKSKSKAFAAGGDKTAALCVEHKPNCGFRILKAEGGFKVLMVPERRDGLPFYLD